VNLTKDETKSLALTLSNLVSLCAIHVQLYSDSNSEQDPDL